MRGLLSRISETLSNERTTVFSRGKSAFDLVSDPFFLEQWLDLNEACSWGTVYQSPDFVKTWYETYREQYVPVILTLENLRENRQGRAHDRERAHAEHERE
ncbi:protein of unknown function (plasmid) [Caballeronia sp. S22]